MLNNSGSEQEAGLYLALESEIELLRQLHSDHEKLDKILM
jgi:hypothetical protein